MVRKVDFNRKALMPAEEIVKRRLRRQKSKNDTINRNFLSKLVIENVIGVIWVTNQQDFCMITELIKLNE